MKAVYQTRYGKSEVLEYGEQNTPEIRPHQVLVQNHATSVNPRDWLIRGGHYQLQFLVPSFPLILGSDLAGEVVRVGSRVSRFKVGDRVFGMKNPAEGLSTYSGEVAVAEKCLAHIPPELSYVEAAGMPLCALTAWQALVDKANIQAGMEVLVIGASGGVGSYAVQIAIALGANVTAVCSSGNADMVIALGASKVIDYHQEDFVEGTDRFDIIFDTIGRHSLSRCAGVLNADGSFVSTVPSPRNLKALAVSKLKSRVMPASKKAHVVMVKSAGDDLVKVADLVASGKVRPVIDSVFPLEQAAKAHDHSRSKRAKGKIILEIA
jgi:NADPH:quinone reductase-like Zn-dependent oxidoreductase